MSDSFELPLLHDVYLSELTEEGIIETINDRIKHQEKLRREVAKKIDEALAAKLERELKKEEKSPVLPLSDKEKSEIAAQVRKQKHEQMLYLISYYSKRDRQLCVVRETAMRHKQANELGHPYPTDLATHIVETVSEW